jgi:O-antigen/teichoic acid export membrane protein
MLSLLLVVFPQLALSLWLHNPELAAKGAPTFRLFMLTVSMNAVCAPAGLLLLNRHRNTTIGVLKSVILLAQGALSIWLTPRLGILSGAIAWLSCGLIQLASAPLIWRAFGRADADAALTRA